jgi:restriction endonuclease
VAGTFSLPAMPIVARLSKKFCDRLGDDVVEELVALLNQVDLASRTELRELNGTNFARFDAKLDQRTAEILAKMDTRFAEFQAQMDVRFADVHAKMDTRFADVHTKLDMRTVELRTELHQTVGAAKESMLRWMVAIWFTQVLTFAGLWLSKG